MMPQICHIVLAVAIWSIGGTPAHYSHPGAGVSSFPVGYADGLTTTGNPAELVVTEWHRDYSLMRLYSDLGVLKTSIRTEAPVRPIGLSKRREIIAHDDEHVGVVTNGALEPRLTRAVGERFVQSGDTLVRRGNDGLTVYWDWGLKLRVLEVGYYDLVSIIDGRAIVIRVRGSDETGTVSIYTNSGELLRKPTALRTRDGSPLTFVDRHCSIASIDRRRCLAIASAECFGRQELEGLPRVSIPFDVPRDGRRYTHEYHALVAIELSSAIATPIAVIDTQLGPGGWGEGFSPIEDQLAVPPKSNNAFVLVNETVYRIPIPLQMRSSR